MPLEALEATGVLLAAGDSATARQVAADRERQLQNRELEGRQKLWRWLIVAAVVVLIVETLLELEGRFGAVTAETQPYRGYWQQEGKTYRDELIRVFVDVDDSPVNHDFFVSFKEILKQRFQQIEIWMTTYLIQVI